MWCSASLPFSILQYDLPTSISINGFFRDLLFKMIFSNTLAQYFYIIIKYSIVRKIASIKCNNLFSQSSISNLKSSARCKNVGMNYQISLKKEKQWSFYGSKYSVYTKHVTLMLFSDSLLLLKLLMRKYIHTASTEVIHTNLWVFTCFATRDADKILPHKSSLSSLDLFHRFFEY